MTSALFLALVLIAGSVQGAHVPEQVNIPDIIASLPDIIANLPGLIVENLPNIIAAIPNINWPDVIATITDILSRLPEIIANIDWPSIIAQLPENIQDIIANFPDSIPGIIAQLPDNIQDIIANFPDSLPDIIALLPESIQDIIANIPDIIANLPDIIASLPDIIPDIIANLPDNIQDIIASLPDIDWPAVIDSLPEIVSDPGVPAAIQEFPSLVQIEVGYSTIWAQGCDGSILNSVSILTAARCVFGRFFDNRILRIRAGSNVRGREGVVYPVSNALAHPSFGNNGFDGDVALVRIQGFIIYGPTIQPTGITSQGVFFPAGVRVTNAGWGSTAQGTLIADRDLYKVDLVVVDNAQCTSEYANYLVPITVTPNMICAGRPASGGRKADMRDAGGPLYYENTVVGVMSFGRYIGNDKMPVVFTSVSSYTNWIAANAV